LFGVELRASSGGLEQGGEMLEGLDEGEDGLEM
jgi:hypothetical protein